MAVVEYRGVRKLMGAIMTINGNTETYGTPFDIAGVAEIQREVESSSATHYYDNAPAIVIDSVGADTVTISASALSADVLAKITGQVYDAAKGMLVEGNPSAPYMAIGYVTSKTDGSDVYVWRLKGKFSVPNESATTKDDGTDASGQELTFTGINTGATFTANGGKTAKAVIVDSSVNTNVSDAAWFNAVLTPDTVTNFAG